MSSPNNSTGDSKLSGRLFMYIKKRSSTNIESCGTPAWTDEQDKDSPLKPTLWNRSAFTGHITRLINKINEKLSLNDNFKIIKCLEEQLYQILEKLKGVNDEYMSSAMNPEDIENASEI